MKVPAQLVLHARRQPAVLERLHGRGARANRDLFVGPVFVTIWPLNRLDVPGWIWAVPIAIVLGIVVYFLVGRRTRASAV